MENRCQSEHSLSNGITITVPSNGVAVPVPSNGVTVPVPATNGFHRKDSDSQHSSGSTTIKTTPMKIYKSVVVPINEHHKSLRSETLFITKDDNDSKSGFGVKFPIFCCGFILGLIITIISISVITYYFYGVGHIKFNLTKFNDKSNGIGSFLPLSLSSDDKGANDNFINSTPGKADRKHKHDLNDLNQGNKTSTRRDSPKINKASLSENWSLNNTTAGPVTTDRSTTTTTTKTTTTGIPVISIEENTFDPSTTRDYEDQTTTVVTMKETSITNETTLDKKSIDQQDNFSPTVTTMPTLTTLSNETKVNMTENDKENSDENESKNVSKDVFESTMTSVGDLDDSEKFTDIEGRSSYSTPHSGHGTENGEHMGHDDEHSSNDEKLSSTKAIDNSFTTTSATVADSNEHENSGSVAFDRETAVTNTTVAGKKELDHSLNLMTTTEVIQPSTTTTEVYTTPSIPVPSIESSFTSEKSTDLLLSSVATTPIEEETRPSHDLSSSVNTEAIVTQTTTLSTPTSSEIPIEDLVSEMATEIPIDADEKWHTSQGPLVTSITPSEFSNNNSNIDEGNNSEGHLTNNSANADEEIEEGNKGITASNETLPVDESELTNNDSTDNSSLTSSVASNASPDIFKNENTFSENQAPETTRPTVHIEPTAGISVHIDTASPPIFSTVSANETVSSEATEVHNTEATALTKRMIAASTPTSESALNTTGINFENVTLSTDETTTAAIKTEEMTINPTTIKTQLLNISLPSTTGNDLENDNSSITIRNGNLTETETKQNFTCPEKTFPCLSIEKHYECKDISLLCDGLVQCLDGFDERNCTQSCGQDFNCGNSSYIQCLPKRMQCDGLWDCADGKDERNCYQNNCNAIGERVSCQDKSNCILPKQVCDGKYDCNDHSDELSCVEPSACVSSGKFMCENKLCIDYSLRCDGIIDCTDGLDEINCTCKESEFQCFNGECIPADMRCNGITECRDTSDEWSCVKIDQNNVVQVIDPVSNQWSLLCYNENMTKEDADEICHEMGYGFANNFSSIPLESTYWLTSTGSGTYNSTANCTNKLATKVSCEDNQCSIKRDLVNKVGTSREVPSLVKIKTDDNTVNNECLAEIITPVWLLGSANCFKDDMMYTSVWLNETTKIGEIERIIKHPHTSKFRSFLFRDYDLSLIKLKKPIKLNEDQLSSICLPNQEVQTDITCFLKKFTDTVEPITYNVDDLSLCNEANHYNGSLSKRQLCSKSRSKQRTDVAPMTENEDQVSLLGLPLVCLSSESKWFIAGFLSYFPQRKAFIEHPVIFSNVYSMRNFIEKVIGYRNYGLVYENKTYSFPVQNVFNGTNFTDVLVFNQSSNSNISAVNDNLKMNKFLSEEANETTSNKTPMNDFDANLTNRSESTTKEASTLTPTTTTTTIAAEVATTPAAAEKVTLKTEEINLHSTNETNKTHETLADKTAEINSEHNDTLPNKVPEVVEDATQTISPIPIGSSEESTTNTEADSNFGTLTTTPSTAENSPTEEAIILSTILTEAVNAQTEESNQPTEIPLTAPEKSATEYSPSEPSSSSPISTEATVEI